MKLSSNICATPFTNPLNLKGTLEENAKADIGEIYDKKYSLLILTENLKKKLGVFPEIANDLK